MNLGAFTIPSIFGVLGLLIIAALLALLVSRRRRTARNAAPLHWMGWLRLLGFGLLALLLTLWGLVTLNNFHEMNAEIAPANRAVALPEGAAYPFEEIRFAGADGVPFAGWYLPPQNGKMVLLLHGYGGTRADMRWHAEVLAKAGYGVLLYDERASGESGGSRRSYGWEDAPDVGRAIQFIQSRLENKPPAMGILGCSIGAQIAIQAAVQFPEIQAVWADGTSNIRAIDYPPPHSVLSALVQASAYKLDWMFELKLGHPAPRPMIEQIGLVASRPLMLVGGGSELDFFGSEAARVNHFASYAGPGTQIWVIPEAVHCDGPQKQPEEYARRLVQFFDAALPADR